jgi:transcription antitermination factor NusG
MSCVAEMERSRSDGPTGSVCRMGWYAVQTRYQCEQRVDEQLRHYGFETFLPLMSSVRVWSDRKKKMSTPMFPGYEMVRFLPTAENRVRILQAAGVCRFVALGSELSMIEEYEIDAIRTLMQQRIECHPAEFFVKGQKVRVRGGCLDGLEGEMIELRGRRELVLSIGVIQRSIKIDLDSYNVEKVF